MESIKFTLLGDGATFKRPHINTVNLTYSNIHRIALFGILGAMIGLKGHKDKGETEKYPEFYEKLKKMKVAIVPYNNGKFRKAIKTFTETTGFFNDRQTFIVKEQFLIQPKWDIYLMTSNMDKEVYEKVKNALLKKESVYEFYLGKNHFPGTIENVEVLNMIPVNSVDKIHSIFPSDKFEIEDSFDFNDDCFVFREYMPVRFIPHINHYIEEEFCFTNHDLNKLESLEDVYMDESYKRNLFFI